MKKNKHFVFDTNLLISAFIFPKSIPGQALVKAVTIGTICISNETFDELSNVLFRKKFDRYLSIASRQEVLIEFIKLTECFSNCPDISICRDPKDNKFLALAQSCKADYLISGDGDLLDIVTFSQTQIITATQFLLLK